MNSKNQNSDELINQMTLEEKAGLCSGQGWWHTKTVERLGIKAIQVSDGPSGLRCPESNQGNENDSIVAVSFPCGCAAACSFDKELLKTEGQVLGNEAASQKLAVLLGPAINMKRSPLCGRNFEYFTEDPYLAGELAAGYTMGVQNKGVGVCLKHFAANNQEFRRLSVDEKIDERTLREIYLPAFEAAIKKAEPASVMCSYNAINGVLASENKWLLTEVLRKDWNFKGFVVSDWGAVSDRVKGLKAGLNLEMPDSGGLTDSYIVKAVKDGTIDEVDLNKSVKKLLDFILEYYEKEVDSGNRDKAVFDKEKDHQISGEIASECCVLLKNENQLLPLKKQGQKILFAGEFAKVPRFEGGGSSNIKTYRVTSALDAAKAKGITVDFTQGYDANGVTQTENQLTEAVEKAKTADTVVIFAGLPDSYESEGFDRETLDMPESHNKLIEEIAKVNRNVVVVLHNGSPVTMPWINNPNVKAVLECYLGGEAIGNAQIELLFGEKNPSGKLAETFPLRIEDTPCFLNFPGNGRYVNYAEGIFIGYRWYDTRKINVLFPFGYGLSYTTYEYKNLKVEQKTLSDGNPDITVSVDIKNTGNFDGKEIVQLYVSDKTGFETRPVKELKGFEKVSLKAGEEKTVKFTLDKRSFAFWSMDLQDWYIPAGAFQILIGASSADIRLTKEINLKASAKKAFTITRQTTPGDMFRVPEMKPVISEFLIKNYGPDSVNEEYGYDTNLAFSRKTLRDFYMNAPFRQQRGINGQTDEDVDKLVKEFNDKLDK